MPGENEQDPDNPNDKDAGGGKGTDEIELEKLLDREEVKRAIQAREDRRVEQALKTERQKSAERERAAAEKARRQEEEKRLLDDKNFQELAARKEAEANEHKAKLEAYERQLQVNQLLDKEEVNPKFRGIFLAMSGDLTELKARIDEHNAAFNEAVQEAVNKRLGSEPPPHGKQPDPGRPAKLSQLRTTADKTAFITKYGFEEYKKLVDANQ